MTRDFHEHSSRPGPPLANQSGAIVGRLGLLVAVVGGAGLLVTTMLLPGAIALDRAVANVRDTVLDVPPLGDDIESPPVTSVMLGANGAKLAELHGEQDRVPVDLDRVPEITQNAVLATEDANFWQHNGVNHRAIMRAFVANVESGTIEQGASTITQQYVRNIPGVGLEEDTIERKITEAIWAVEIEKRLSKREILERYLNTVYFGNGIYGIGTASRYYFSKPVQKLNLPESAMLAGLIRSPERNNPLKDFDAAYQRRNIVISQMERQGMISAEEAEGARNADGLGLQIRPDEAPEVPFFVEWVKQVLTDPRVDLQPEAQAALGETEQERINAVFQGGLVVHTTLFPQMQRTADETITDYLTDPLQGPLGSIITVKPNDGAVVAMAVGPKKFGECPDDQPVCEFTKVNPAVPGIGGSGREPGSAFKPIVHTAALANGFSPGYSAETSSGQRVEDCDSRDSGEGYLVNNYAGSGGGYMDMYEATKRSNNVYHVKLARDVGIENVVEIAKQLGITHSQNLNDPRYFGPQSCSIGLGTASVFPLDMASAFATLANRGEHCRPFVVTRIEDRAGNLLYKHTPQCEQVIEQGVADRVTDVIQGPPSSGGTAPYVRGQLGRPVAGKTGTTQDWTNAWFAGYVPQFATAAWVGYEFSQCTAGVPEGAPCGSMFGVEANGVYYDRVTGGSIPGHMWADYMARILDGVETEGFNAPPPIPTVQVPSVVGDPVETARSRIDSKDLKSTVSYVTDHRPAGTVVNQTPAAGSEVWTGSVVRLQVSDGEGEEPQSTVPDVVGLTEQEAVSVIEGAGLDARVLYKRADGPEEVGRVANQSPEAGAEVEPGSQVVIAVGQDGSEGGDEDDGGNGGSDGGGGDDDDDGGPGNGRGGGNGGDRDGTDSTDSASGTTTTAGAGGTSATSSPSDPDGG